MLDNRLKFGVGPAGNTIAVWSHLGSGSQGKLRGIRLWLEKMVAEKPRGVTRKEGSCYMSSGLAVCAGLKIGSEYNTGMDLMAVYNRPVGEADCMSGCEARTRVGVDILFPEFVGMCQEMAEVCSAENIPSA